MKIGAAVAKGLLRGVLKVDLDGGGKESLTLNSQLPDISLAEYLETPKDSLLVFDDLERCSIPIAETPGYINAFVEHEGYKAIILANEVELRKRADARYDEIREKVIGQTLEVRPSTRSALKHFLGLIRDENVKGFLDKNFEAVLLLHNQSETHNLRALKQSLWDFERLASAFSSEHWAKAEPMGILLKVVIALSIQLRTGALQQEQFGEVQVNRITRYLRARKGEETGPAAELEKRYPEVRFDQNILNSELLADLFFKGWVRPEDIQAQLNRSPHYAPPGTQPAWRTAWHGFEINDAQYEQAVKEVESEFAQRKFVIPGEMFHVFGLRLYFAEIGSINLSKPEVVRECIQYIEELRMAGKIGNIYTEEVKLDRARSWDGLGFSQAESEEFMDIVRYYDRILNEVASEILPDFGKRILALLKDSPDRFLRALCVNSFEDTAFYNVPVLATIPPNEFVDTVLQVNPNSQIQAFSTFKARYENQILERELKAEKSWLEEVKRLFEQRAQRLRPMSRHRILSLITRNVDPLLAEQNIQD